MNSSEFLRDKGPPHKVYLRHSAEAMLLFGDTAGKVCQFVLTSSVSLIL